MFSGVTSLYFLWKSLKFPNFS